MGCLCPKIYREKPNDALSAKLNEEPAPIGKEKIDAEIITVGQPKFQDLDKKRKLAEYLLNSDLNIFKRHLPEVQKLNDEDFNELFEGNTEYKFNTINEREFKQLAQKFQDNKELLLEFYSNENYYSYILKIWRPNILQSLKSADPKKKDEIFKRYKIDVFEWDGEFTERFNIIIDTPPVEELLANRFKNYIQADYGDFDELIQNVDKCKKKIQNDEESHCNKTLRANLETSMTKVIKDMVPKYLENLKKELPNLYKDIKKKEEENAIKDILDSGLTKENEKKLIHKVKKIYEKKEFDPLKFDFNKESNKLKELSDKFNQENYETNVFARRHELNFMGTDLSEKAEVVFSNKIVKDAILGLSMANLTYSVAHVSQSLSNYNQYTEQFRNRIDIIRKNFNKHQSEVKIIEDEEDVDILLEQIIKIGKKFNQDLSDVKDLIKDIKDAKNNVVTERNKSIFNLAISGGGIVVNVVAMNVTKGEDRIDFAKSSAAQVLSFISNCVDIHTQNKMLGKFGDYLQEAEALREQITNEIDKLRTKFSGLSGKHYN